jgi:hypothetical protein
MRSSGSPVAPHLIFVPVIVCLAFALMMMGGDASWMLRRVDWAVRNVAEVVSAAASRF